jgi:hypothetical protein
MAVGLAAKARQALPPIARKDSAPVSRGLRQFSIAYLMSGKRVVSMPSRIADGLWDEFILYTRKYQRYCRRTFSMFMYSHVGHGARRESQRRCGAAPGVVVLLQIRKHRCKESDTVAAVVCARRQTEHRKRLRLSPTMRSAARGR